MRAIHAVIGTVDYCKQCWRRVDDPDIDITDPHAHPSYTDDNNPLNCASCGKRLGAEDA